MYRRVFLSGDNLFPGAMYLFQAGNAAPCESKFVLFNPENLDLINLWSSRKCMFHFSDGISLSTSPTYCDSQFRDQTFACNHIFSGRAPQSGSVGSGDFELYKKSILSHTFCSRRYAEEPSATRWHRDKVKICGELRTMLKFSRTLPKSSIKYSCGSYRPSTCTIKFCSSRRFADFDSEEGNATHNELPYETFSSRISFSRRARTRHSCANAYAFFVPADVQRQHFFQPRLNHRERRKSAGLSPPPPSLSPVRRTRHPHACTTLAVRIIVIFIVSRRVTWLVSSLSLSLPPPPLSSSSPSSDTFGPT